MVSTNSFIRYVLSVASLSIGASSFSLSIHHHGPERAQISRSFHRRSLSGQSFQSRGRTTHIFADNDEDEGSSSEIAAEALPPAAISALPPAAKDDSANSDDNEQTLVTEATSVGTTALFIDQQSKRILIEELGYKRAEVERLRPELAQPILAQRMVRPATIPSEWLLAEDDTNAAMIARLENESKYPLKFPLLGVSLVLFGKGLSDALITLIKVNMDFPGVSLGEQFMGVPVLAIDAVCVLAGAALGWWTWNAMKD